jgi:hypothetical protein
MDSFGHQVVKIRPKQNANGDGPQCVVFLANFRNLATKKKGDFRDFKKQSPYIDQKNLEVARYRHCVPVGRQN